MCDPVLIKWHYFIRFHSNRAYLRPPNPELSLMSSHCIGYNGTMRLLHTYDNTAQTGQNSEIGFWAHEQQDQSLQNPGTWKK